MTNRATTLALLLTFFLVGFLVIGYWIRKCCVRTVRMEMEVCAVERAGDIEGRAAGDGMNKKERGERKGDKTEKSEGETEGKGGVKEEKKESKEEKKKEEKEKKGKDGGFDIVEVGGFNAAEEASAWSGKTNGEATGNWNTEEASGNW